jgi:uncharacterized protein (TIGR02647 family)
VNVDELFLNELNFLLKFPDSAMEGLKVHHIADPSIIQAAKQLHEKGLITQEDGGYLTELGQEALETAEQLINLMTPR